MTEKLFDDGMLMEFDAEVISCIPVKNAFEVVLDRTAFFPEGGGQAGDTGIIGGSAVSDTYERNGDVIHRCTLPLSAGSRVRCSIDRDIRLRRMQDHSGEHLLMGIIHRKYGYENVGFHLGSSEVTLDLNGVITPDELRGCEQEANEAVAMDIPINISYPDRETLASLEYRSKLEMTGNVRIVTIEGIDVCACCAPHLHSTGQIGMVKIISSENYKGGTRVHILCGLDALDIIRERMDSVSAISAALSAKPEETASAVGRLLAENNSLKRELFRMEKRKADEIIGGLKNGTRKSFCIFTDGIRSDIMRDIANRTVHMTEGAAGVFGKEENGWRYIIASEKMPLRKKAREINSALGGKGGGSDIMIQGSVSADRADIENVFEEIFRVQKMNDDDE